MGKKKKRSSAWWEDPAHTFEPILPGPGDDLLPWQVACDDGWSDVTADLGAAEPGQDITVDCSGTTYKYSFVSKVQGSQLNAKTGKVRPLRRLIAATRDGVPFSRGLAAREDVKPASKKEKGTSRTWWKDPKRFSFEDSTFRANPIYSAGSTRRDSVPFLNGLAALEDAEMERGEEDSDGNPSDVAKHVER